MADELREWKPSRPALARLAEILRQGMGGAEQLLPESRYAYDLLGLPAVATTLERLGYGDRLTRGRGQTLQMLPETAEAAMFGLDVAPLARAGAKLVSRGALRGSDAAVRAITGNPAATAMRVIEETRMPTPAAVIKPKGGNWLAGTVESKLEPLKTFNPDAPQQLREYLDMAIADQDPTLIAQYRGWVDRAERAQSVNDWIDKKLAKYIRNEMATEQDPLRELARRGISATPETELIRASEYTPDKLADVRRAYGYDPYGLEARQAAGRVMTPEEEASFRRASGWERIADEAMGIYDPENAYVDDLLRRYPEASPAGQGLREANPWLTKPMPASTKVYGEGLFLGPDTGFRHLTDELRNAINPESGLPPELLWKYSDLNKVSVPQAVEHVAKINEWRAAQKALADAAKARNPATHVFKEYPEKGFSWVELKTPESKLAEGETIKYLPEVDMWGIYDSQGGAIGMGATEREAMGLLRREERRKSLEDALKYEGDTMGHCVGGYCPDVESGKSRIFSLRDKKGEPHVTIEVRPSKSRDKHYTDWLRSQPEQVQDEVTAAAVELHNANPKMGYGEALNSVLADRVGPIPEDIIQIKGKANRAPKAEYLPAVQDFVRSQKWGAVGDLQNTGLVSATKERFDIPRSIGPGAIPRLEELGIEPGYYTEQELIDAINTWRSGGKPAAEGFASGGLVSTDYDPARIASLVDDLSRELQLV